MWAYIRTEDGEQYPVGSTVYLIDRWGRRAGQNDAAWVQVVPIRWPETTFGADGVYSQGIPGKFRVSRVSRDGRRALVRRVAP